jgi:HPr kinase/phosphorylase
VSEGPEKTETMQVHGTAVALDGCGILLCGPSGAGKSDLALRLLDRGARLIADDRCDLRRSGGRLLASAPAAIAGRMEVRGLGIVEVPVLDEAALDLAVDLVPPDAVPRLPEPAFRTFLGLRLPLLRLAPFEASTPAKLVLATAPGGPVLDGRDGGQ